MEENKIFDVAIIGGGPAGVASAIYVTRANKSAVLIEKNSIGGQLLYISEIDNYPGFVERDGFALAMNMAKQLKDMNVPLVSGEATALINEGELKKIVTTSGTFYARSCILCLGAGSKKLGLEKEVELTGSGISYCAICDGNFFRESEVAVVGGGNTAIEDAVYLASVVKKVHLIHRKLKYDADPALLSKLHILTKGADAKIIEHTPFVVGKIIGERQVDGIEIIRTDGAQKQVLNVNGVFVAIGRVPSSDWLGDQIERDENGYILVDENMQTNIAGVFAGGDAVKKSLRQIVTAVSDGAVCAINAIKSIRK